MIIKTLYSNKPIRIHHREWMQYSLCVFEIFLSVFGLSFSKPKAKRTYIRFYSTLSVQLIKTLCSPLYFPYFKDMDTGVESFGTPAVVPKPPNNIDILLKNKSSGENVPHCDAAKEAKQDSAIKAEASTVTSSPISEETRRFRAAVVSAVRRKCHIPLRKLRSAVLDAALANGGQLEVRNVRLKLDLPLIRIRQGQWTGELSVETNLL